MLAYIVFSKLNLKFFDFYDGYKYCERCGERNQEGKGLCETCQAEYEDFVSRDD